MNPARRADHVEPERARHVLIDGPPRRLAVEGHAPAEEELGVEIAEQQVGVGHGREPAPEVVAGGPGVRAGAVGSNLEQAQSVHAGDGAAPGADLDHLDDGHPHGQPRPLLEAIGARHLELPRHQRRTVVDDTRFGRGATHVEGEHAPLATVPRRQRRGEGTAGGAGLDQSDRQPASGGGQSDAARGLHDVELSGNAKLRQPPLQILEVALQERGHVDVG